MALLGGMGAGCFSTLGNNPFGMLSPRRLSSLFFLSALYRCCEDQDAGFERKAVHLDPRLLREDSQGGRGSGAL